jgi:predicted  nucleic acid-binding Zn-ribbon protein
MNSDQRPGFWQRLALAIIKTLLAILVLTALAVGGYLAFIEVRRSFDTVTTRIEINRRDLEEMQSELGSTVGEAQERYQQITTLESEVEQLEQGLDSLGADIGSDVGRQQEMLVALEERLTTAMSDIETALESSQSASDETVSLGTAIVALQGDLNETSGRIDSLGGEIDELRAETGALDSSVGDLSQLTGLAVAAASEITEMQHTVALFHIWELLTRARLRLFESNIGQATADMERAFRAIDALGGTSPAADDGALVVVQTRLAFSFSNLPENPIVAARDLESAWDELDQILMARLVPEFETGRDLSSLAPIIVVPSPEPSLETVPVPSPTPSP